jgi:hypothetical protein
MLQVYGMTALIFLAWLCRSEPYVVGAIVGSIVTLAGSQSARGKLDAYQGQLSMYPPGYGGGAPPVPPVPPLPTIRMPRGGVSMPPASESKPGPDEGALEKGTAPS